jgi:hypothetical protein
VPWNVLSPEEEVLIKVFCGPSSAKIQIGNGSNVQYICHIGAVWKPGTNWQLIEFSGTNRVGSWYVGNAAVTPVLTYEELQNTNAVVAYICTWTGAEWKCGCRDSVCTIPYWQIQEFHGFAGACQGFFSGWTPDCNLVAKLREGAYFNIPQAQVSDDQLLHSVQ